MIQAIQKNQSYLSAVLLTICSSALVASTAIIGKYLIPLVNLPTLIFLRLAIPACILWCVAYILKTPKNFEGSQTLLIQRSLMSMLTQTCFFIYLFYGSAFNATLLLMTSPLFAPLISRIFDKTPIKPQQWFSLTLSFMGIALILKPTTGIFHWPAFIGLASGFFHAWAQWTYHKMSKTSSPLLITTHMYTYGTLFAAIPLTVFTLYTGHLGFHQDAIANLHLSITIILFLSIALAAIGTQILRGKAFTKVNKAHSLMPFLYTAVVFTGIYDAIFFHSPPTLSAIFGAILIFMGLNILVVGKLFFCGGRS